MTMAALTKDVFCLEVFQVADPSSQEIQSLLVDVDRYIGERLQAPHNGRVFVDGVDSRGLLLPL